MTPGTTGLCPASSCRTRRPYSSPCCRDRLEPPTHLETCRRCTDSVMFELPTSRTSSILTPSDGLAYGSVNMDGIGIDHSPDFTRMRCFSRRPPGGGTRDEGLQHLLELAKDLSRPMRTRYEDSARAPVTRPPRRPRRRLGVSVKAMREVPLNRRHARHFAAIAWSA